jgi:4-amino-4-deoxy-L-arabinose transferase-like glycosyltransferase
MALFRTRLSLEDAAITVDGGPENDYATFVKSILLALLLIALYFFDLGERPFATPDEGRYVEIPREMVATGNWVTPRLNGVKYFEKPPLFYWLQATVQKYVGLNEVTMRLCTVLFALLGLGATYLFCRRYLTRQTSLNATLILGSSVLYFSLSRLIILDMPVSILNTLGMFAFYRGFHASSLVARRLWFYAFALSCALGVLVKGIMCLALMGPVIVAWLTLMGGWAHLRPFYPLSTMLVFVAVAAPWHVMAALENPEFLHKYFVVEHLLRYTTTVHMRYQPFWYFVPVILLGMLPWQGLLFTTLAKARQSFKASRLHSFLWLWAAWVLLFFSFSNSKLIPYILPLFPPLSILMALAFERADVYKLSVSSSLMFLVIGAGLLMAELFFPELKTDKQTLGLYLQFLAVVMILGAALVFEYRRRGGQKLFHCMLLLQVVVALTLIKAAPSLQRPTVKPFAAYINAHKSPGDRIVSFMSYYQDLPVYVGQTVTVVEAKGELEFGTQVEDTSAWMVDSAAFNTLWQQGVVWAVGRESEVLAHVARTPSFPYRVIMRDNGTILFTNKQEG